MTRPFQPAAQDREKESPLPTRYDPLITQDYVELFRPQSPFNWLSKILEDQALALLPADRATAILDLACGIGSFCARAHRRGYRWVVGTDLSASQVDAARRMFAGGPRFEVSDARSTHELPGFHGAFDVVNASWLYDTANDPNDAIVMARSARACLRPGGRHQGIEVNPGIKASAPFELEAFGIALLPDAPPGSRPRDGQRIAATIKTGGDIDDILTTHVTYFDEASLHHILGEAGFCEIAFQPPQTWILREQTAAEDRSKFERYVGSNPEMISFTAIA
jgi:SAM-dependent methyltransferase